VPSEDRGGPTISRSASFTGITGWVRRVYHHSGHEEVTYAIHEAHYREEGKGSGKCDITMNPTDVSGESVDDLKWTLEHMLKGRSTRPVLDYDTREEIADGSTQKQATGDSGLLPRGPRSTRPEWLTNWLGRWWRRGWPRVERGWRRKVKRQRAPRAKG